SRSSAGSPPRARSPPAVCRRDAGPSRCSRNGWTATSGWGRFRWVRGANSFTLNSESSPRARRILCEGALRVETPAPELQGHATLLLPGMRSKHTLALLALAGLAALGATTLLPARVDEVARSVEGVRGRHFARSVAASEIDASELKKLLRGKLA